MRHDSSAAFTEAEPAQSSAFGSPVPKVRSTPAELNGIIRLLTCGSVDDGKSTLIGRLLWDASPLYDDQREKLLKETASLHGGKRPDFSRLVDGLIAEQEQGITIDIAWHYFDTGQRRVVIIDSPGHEQYTRNMATGASHADVAVLLVDAQAGIKRQTRRHLAILDLAGVRSVVLAVNKMDLVGWSESRFNEISASFAALASRFPSLSWTIIPVSALNGDNVATRSQSMGWYSGPTFVEFLEKAKTREDNVSAPFRMPVQMVLRDGQSFRGLAGTVTAGEVRVGDPVRDALSGKKTSVEQIVTMDGALQSARCGQAVVLKLADEIDVGRGSILTSGDEQLAPTRALDVRLVWLSNNQCSPKHSYLLRTGTDVVPVVSLETSGNLDLDTLELTKTGICETNDIAEARVTLARPIATDRFGDHRDTGAFMIVDAVTGAAVAGGVVLAAVVVNSASRDATFTLTREILERGLSAGLPDSEDGKAEFRRRADEVALILRTAGIAVELDV